jgi:hypothetical protein
MFNGKASNSKKGPVSVQFQNRPAETRRIYVDAALFFGKYLHTGAGNIFDRVQR